MWHMKHGIWQMTYDRWGEVNILSKLQLLNSYSLGVKVLWIYFHKVEEVSEIIFQDELLENIHSKAGVFKYIILEIPL